MFTNKHNKHFDLWQRFSIASGWVNTARHPKASADWKPACLSSYSIDLFIVPTPSAKIEMDRRVLFIETPDNFRRPKTDCNLADAN